MDVSRGGLLLFNGELHAPGVVRVAAVPYGVAVDVGACRTTQASFESVLDFRPFDLMRYTEKLIKTWQVASMRVSHDSRNFFLEGPAGRLEAILWAPSTAARHRPPLAAVVCHPHPLYGGTMHNKVVYQAAKSLDALALPVLRFNFRGAGLSAGRHDRGVGEQRDVRAALDFLAKQFPGVPLLLAGFSFGAWVGLRVGCEEPRVSHLIGLGIPVNSLDFSFLRQCKKPKLFVHGSKDQYGALERVKRLVASLTGENHLVVVEAVDHFFAGKLNELDAAITNWLREVFHLRH